MAVRVLIVDDQESFRAAAREVVRVTEGFELAGEASSGEDSVEAARRLHPDLVLMDVNLPGIDGIEASRRIRSERAEVVVFLLPTYDPAEFQSRMAESGANTFIPKSDFRSGQFGGCMAEVGRLAADEAATPRAGSRSRAIARRGYVHGVWLLLASIKDVVGTRPAASGRSARPQTFPCTG